MTLLNARENLENPTYWYDALLLTDIAALTPSDGAFIVGDGSTWVTESGATARTSLGLGTIATQNASNVAITGGSITGITDLAVADGGTGASTASAARTNLGLGTMATQNANGVAITGGSVSGITDIAIADGGTGASTAATARTNLGLGTVAFHATNSTAQSISAGSWTTVTFDTEQFDTSSNFASSAFTAPTTGLYMFGGGFVVDVTGSTPVAARAGFSLNGASPTNYARASIPAAAIADLLTSVTHTTLMSLTAADVVRLQAFYTTNGADTAATNNSHFWGYRIA